VHPCTQLFRAARSRASHSVVRIRSRRIRRTRLASAPFSLRQIRKTPLPGALCVSGGESGTKRAKPYAIDLPTELRPGCVLVNVPGEYPRHIKKCNVTSDSSELRRRAQGAVADKNGASLHFMKSPALLELLSGCS